MPEKVALVHVLAFDLAVVGFKLSALGFRV